MRVTVLRSAASADLSFVADDRRFDDACLVADDLCFDALCFAAIDGLCFAMAADGTRTHSAPDAASAQSAAVTRSLRNIPAC